MKKYISQVTLALSIGLVSFVFFVVTLSALGLLVGVSISWLWVPLSLIASMLGVFVYLNHQNLTRAWAWPIVLCVIILVSVAASSKVMDFSSDGNSYHKSAIGLLANGWNPVRQDVNRFNTSEKNRFQLVGVWGSERPDAKWINHYPKATWLFAASVYKTTGNIESGKAITPITMVALGLLSFNYFYSILKRNQALVVSLLMVFNPITVSQVYSYYVDGLMGNLLMLFMLLVAHLVKKKMTSLKGEALIYGAILMVIALLVNVKFTGLVYAGAVAACYWLYIAASRDWKRLLYFSATGLTGLIIGLGIIGSSSYVKNMITKGSPVYPLMGKGSVNFLAVEQPAGYSNVSYIHKFVKSNLVPTSQTNFKSSLEHGAPRLKIPFTATIDEIALLDNVDLRQAGYGIWFGGILIASVLLSLYLVLRYGQVYKKHIVYIVLPLISIGLCVLLVDGTWWARYLPQLIVFPATVVCLLYLVRHTAVATALTFALFFNVALTSVVGFQTQFTKQVTVARGMHELSCNNTSSAKVYSSLGLDGSLFNIHDRCKNLQLLSPQQFSEVKNTERTEVYPGVYLVK